MQGLRIVPGEYDLLFLMSLMKFLRIFASNAIFTGIEEYGEDTGLRMGAYLSEGKTKPDLADIGEGHAISGDSGHKS